MYLYFSVGMYITSVLSHSDSCLCWCLAYISEGIFEQHIYVAVTSPYPPNRGVTTFLLRNVRVASNLYQNATFTFLLLNEKSTIWSRLCQNARPRPAFHHRNARSTFSLVCLWSILNQKALIPRIWGKSFGYSCNGSKRLLDKEEESIKLVSNAIVNGSSWQYSLNTTATLIRVSRQYAIGC